MHSKEDIEKLSQMGDKEKILATRSTKLDERNKLISRHEYRYVSKNEYPHTNRGDKQYIVWKNGKGKKDINSEPSAAERRELLYIKNRMKLPGFARNRPQDCSVKRYHVHLFN